MGFLSRLAQLIKSNLNDLINKSEDPEKMLNQVIVDEDVVLPSGTEIGYDLEADRARFDVTDNGAVLVTRDRLASLGARD